MIGSLFFNIYALILSLLGSKRGRSIYFLIALVAIFVFLAIRYDYGNDLPTYRGLFESYEFVDLADIVAEKDSVYEIGYRVLNKAFSPLGFSVLLSFCAFLSMWGYYYFARKAVDGPYLFFALFILVFNPNLVLTQSSAVRQTIAISIFFLSSPFLVSRRLVPYLACCLLAMTFHFSAIVLLPFYFIISPKPVEFKRLLPLIGLFFALVLYGRFFVGLAINFALTALGLRYAGFYSSGVFKLFEMGSGIRIYFSAIMMLVLMKLGEGCEGYKAVAIKAAVYAPIMLALGFGFPLAGRLSMYLEPFSAMAVPIAISRLRYRSVKYLAIIFYATYLLATYYAFFRDPIWRDSFATYTNIFFKGSE